VLKTGEADYLLFAGGKVIATVESKSEKNVPDVSTMKASLGATKIGAAFTYYSPN
jgi:type I site-specific restriction endonuclease